ncbi:histidinol-phosphate transaminase [uncultured Porticoccus sp.]|uniref:histidinol-phosphate transaminase n=1 Tax=uncultured Porticoccus sp. TaxID=1256050 RepID=UPI0026216E50|nr:histidinol-phosphate transaminase [uncultured Porticoccus sp.]
MSSPFWSDVVARLDPYVPGEQPKLANLTKLNTNENPYGPSPRVLEAIAGELGDSLRLYPDPNGALLKQAVADYYAVAPDQVFLGNGSDEVLAHIFQALLKHDEPILFPDITYSFYPVYCGLYQVDYQRIPLGSDYRIQVADYLRNNGGIIFPNPNAPTGMLLSLPEIEWLLKKNQRSVLVVDEAYIDFGGETAVSLVGRYPNLLVTQTLSKSRSLAGLRIGFAIGDVALIEALERVKNSFNSYPLSRFAIVGGAAAFADDDYFREVCEQVIRSRDRLATGLKSLGFEVLPSSANFLLATCPSRDAAGLAARLREKGIIVRHFRQPRIEQFLRITVGTNEQNCRLLDVLAELLKQ